MPANYKTLTLGAVKRLASSLIEVADRYPRLFVTEVDFYPLVVAVLSLELKGLQAEAPLEGGQAVDFKVRGTTNPAYLELAVAPRAMGDIESVLDAVRVVGRGLGKPGELDADDAMDLVEATAKRLRQTDGSIGLPDKTQLYASVNETELRSGIKTITEAPGSDRRRASPQA
jgi:hypothetical protein